MAYAPKPMGQWTGGVTPAPAPAKHIEVFTDGGFDANNQALGTWAFIIRPPGTPLEEATFLTGYMRHTTNNRMEMLAAIHALEHVEIGPRIIVTSDSEYVVKGATTWVDGWAKNGWITGSGSPAKNRDLWERRMVLRDLHNVRFDWVKGHAGNPFNEQCDMLCIKTKKNLFNQLALNPKLVVADTLSSYTPALAAGSAAWQKSALEHLHGEN